MSSLLSSLFGQKNGKSVENLNSTDFENRIKDENTVILDVRTKMEYEDVRIPNSKLIDLMNPAFINEIDSLDKSAKYLLYCRSGNRSLVAGREMVKLGFENVAHLSPGIIGYNGQTESGRN